MADEEQIVEAESAPAEAAAPAESPEAVAPEAAQEVNYWDNFKSLPQFQGQSDRDIASHPVSYTHLTLPTS